MRQIQHVNLPSGEPFGCGVPHLWSVRNEVAFFSAFPWEAPAAKDSAGSHLLSTSDSSSLALPLLLPV